MRTQLSQELATSMRLVIKVKCNSQVILFDSTEVPSDVVVVVVDDVEGLYDKPNSLEIPSQLIYARLDIDSPSHSLSLSLRFSLSLCSFWRCIIQCF